MEIEELKLHKEKFDEIIKKYNLKDNKKASQIAEFLTKSNQNEISSTKFAKKFRMSEKEATIFLSFIHRGIKYKEEVIDQNNNNNNN